MVPKSHFFSCVAFLNESANMFQTLHEIINWYGKHETAAKNLKYHRLRISELTFQMIPALEEDVL